MFEMAKAHQLNPCKYLKYLLEHIPGTDMSDDVLAKHAPWNETVQVACTGIVE